MSNTKKTKGSLEFRKFIPTGCWLLNLALTDNADKGYETSSIANVVGKSHAGKSLFSSTTLAEMAYDKAWDEYDLIQDDTEDGANFDMAAVFGQVAADRIKTPYEGSRKNGGSKTILQCHNAIKKLMDKEKPFVYVIDSLDGLMDETTMELTESNLKKAEEGKKLDGSYNMSKQKYLKQSFFPHLQANIGQSGSIILILSQQTPNIGNAGKSRAGGTALEFFNGLTFWIAPAFKSKLKKTVKGKDIIIGTRVKIDVTKNRITGKSRTIEVCILNGYGVDNIQTSLEWLKEYGYWDEVCEVAGKKVSLMGAMIKHIDTNKLDDKLKGLLQKAWLEVEESVKPVRTPRFGEKK